MMSNLEHSALESGCNRGAGLVLHRARKLVGLITCVLVPDERSDNFNEFVILPMGQHKYDVFLSDNCPTCVPNALH